MARRRARRSPRASARSIDRRWQMWTHGLERTTGSLPVAEGVPEPSVPSPPPDRMPGGAARDLVRMWRHHGEMAASRPPPRLLAKITSSRSARVLY